MDFSPIINQIVGALWYLILIAILAGVFKSSWFKGIVGEFIVKTRFEASALEGYLIGEVPTLNNKAGT